jgi:hypothetical protein
MCEGRGFDDTMSNQLGPGERASYNGKRMPSCWVCKGRKYVFMNKVCECGCSAVIFDATDNIWYCGRDLCKRAVKYRVHGAPAQPCTWQGC